MTLVMHEIWTVCCRDAGIKDPMHRLAPSALPFALLSVLQQRREALIRVMFMFGNRGLPIVPWSTSPTSR